jgi:uncharacterized DUF497 family protein
MKITFDPDKRDRALEERGLDFADAAEVFSGATFDRIDDRRDYGEKRVISRTLTRPDGCGRVDAARRCTACHFDEESQ